MPRPRRHSFGRCISRSMGQLTISRPRSSTGCSCRELFHRPLPTTAPNDRPLRGGSLRHLLWFVMLLISAIPPIPCFVYYHRRLGTRRDLLRQTLLSLRLKDAYMRMRHGDIDKCDREKQFDQSFRKDFRAGLSFSDYLWPVTLATVLGLLGWFFVFDRVYPSFS